MVKAERFAVQHFLPAERKKPRPLKNALCGWLELKYLLQSAKGIGCSVLLS